MQIERSSYLFSSTLFPRLGLRYKAENSFRSHSSKLKYQSLSGTYATGCDTELCHLGCRCWFQPYSIYTHTSLVSISQNYSRGPHKRTRRRNSKVLIAGTTALVSSVENWSSASVVFSLVGQSKKGVDRRYNVCHNRFEDICSPQITAEMTDGTAAPIAKDTPKYLPNLTPIPEYKKLLAHTTGLSCKACFTKTVTV